MEPILAVSMEPPTPQGRKGRWRAVGLGLCGLASTLCLLMAMSLTPSTASTETNAKTTQLAGAVRPVIKPISIIDLGEWVLAKNPTGEQDLEFGQEVDPESWRAIRLLASKKDGSKAEVGLLRPLDWLEEQEARVGGTIEISVPECGIDGTAEVLSINPCSALRPRPGPDYRMVTGTFKHFHARVLDVRITGQSSSIGTTPNHPFWSEDKEDFIRADELRPGTRLRQANDELCTVASITERPGLHTVYNLEVQIDHVYHVATNGVLVHNGGVLCPTQIALGQDPFFKSLASRSGSVYWRNWKEAGITLKSTLRFGRAFDQACHEDTLCVRSHR